MFPLRFFFVLAGAARSSLLFRIADRPLFWGIIFGLVSGLWELGLPLGIIFELLWLDVLPLGSVVPPYGTLSFLLLFPIAELYDWRQPDMLLLPIVFAMLCAYMAAWLEQYQREVMDDASERVQCWCTAAAGGMLPGRAILYSILGRAGAQYALYVVCFLILTAIGPLLARVGAQWFPSVSWAMFYAAAMAGAVLGLRLRRTYAILLVSLIIVGLLMTV